MIYLNGLLVNTTYFPDNTSQVWKLPKETLNETNFANIKWEFSNEGEFLQLAQLKTLLDKHNFRSVLTLTYLPYGRQDKDVDNQATFALHTFSKLLNFLNFEQVIINDAHSVIALNLINNSKCVYPINQLNKTLKETKTTLVCYPDKGALTKYSEVYKDEIGSRYIYGEKTRDQSTGIITGYKVIGDCKDQIVLLVDDLIDGGATFKILANNLLASGAKEVNLFATHGIFSKGIRTLFDSGIHRIFISSGEVFVRDGQQI